MILKGHEQNQHVPTSISGTMLSFARGGSECIYMQRCMHVPWSLVINSMTHWGNPCVPEIFWHLHDFWANICSALVVNSWASLGALLVVTNSSYSSYSSYKQQWDDRCAASMPSHPHHRVPGPKEVAMPLTWGRVGKWFQMIYLHIYIFIIICMYIYIYEFKIYIYIYISWIPNLTILMLNYWNDGHVIQPRAFNGIKDG